MAKLFLHQDYCELDEDDTSLIRDLDNELSYFIQGSQYSKAFRGFYNKSGDFVRWDGRQRFLQKDLTFALGLVERTEEFYQKLNKPLEIINKRIITPSSSIDIYPKLTELHKSPHYYQLNALQATQDKYCGIVRMATGSGKSLVSALIAASFGKKTIIFVIGRALLYQFYQFYCSVFGEDNVGIVGDGKCKIRDINIVSIWTAGQTLGLKKTKVEDEDDEKKIAPEKHKDIKDLLATVKVVIFDECQICACETIQEIAKVVDPEHIYGMSASPTRDDGADMMIEAILGRKIIDISASELIKGGYLVKPTIKFFEVPKLKYKVEKNYHTIYKHYITDNPIRNEKVVKAAVKLVEQGYSTLVLFNSLAHGDTLYKSISEQIPAILLSGKDDQKARDTAKDQLENKKVNCLVASKILDIGVDLPCLSGLVIASSGKSSVRAIQRIGRIIRTYTDSNGVVKNNAAVVDFVDNAHYLKAHSQARYSVYNSEDGFDVSWSK